MNNQYYEGKTNEECEKEVSNLVTDSVKTWTKWDTVRREPCFLIEAGINDPMALTLREARVLRAQLEIALSPFKDFISGEAAK